MSIIKTKVTDESSKKWFSKMILPLYVVLSALFILYVAYSYLGWVVYNLWLNQGASAGQQQGYEAAIVDLMKRVGEKCEPVALTAGETQIDVINVACLEQAPVEQTTEVLQEKNTQ